MGPLIQGFHRPAGADGGRDLTMAPARSRCALSGACFSFLFGRQRALVRGCAWHAATPLSLLWLLFPRQEPRSDQDGGSPRQLFSTISLLPLDLLRIFFFFLRRQGLLRGRGGRAGGFLSLPLYLCFILTGTRSILVF